MKRALPTIPHDRVIAPSPPPPVEGVVSWNMNTTCNYRCSYCTQRFLDDRHRWATDTPAFLDAFGALPTSTGVPWEIKLSGGEPFLHPDFIDVIKGLVQRDLFVSVVTNFSRDDDTIAAFVDAAGDKLRVLSCSLHLEFLPGDKLDRFIAKAARTQQQLLSSSSGSGSGSGSPSPFRER
ncbi:MAG TPA: radical SAM protein, partial [Myxococcota bacterium]